MNPLQTSKFLDFEDFKKSLLFWSDKRNHIAFFENLAKELEIKEWTDWYKVTKATIEKFGGSGIQVLKFILS